jgi:hypothetical protein
LELLTAFWEDYYHDNTIEAKRRPDGEVMFQTGDPYIDKWEQELAQGITPDLLEDLPSWHREKYEKAKKLDQSLQKKAKNVEADLEGFSETYTSPRSP